MSEPAARLWVGRTVHVREQPFRRSFSYAVAMVETDIDRLDEAATQSPLFSVNRPNAIALHTRDHGAREPGASLRAWAEERLAQAGVDDVDGPVRLISFPRVLGHGFAPLSLWFAHGANGDLRGVIYEVHNTFGEAHAYVARVDGDQVRAPAPKEFYVSPFFDVSGGYAFTLRMREKRMELLVENTTAGGRSHVASLMLRPRNLGTGEILRVLAAMPFSGLGVVFAIHWQALLIWLKGAKFRDRLPARANRTTVVDPAAEPVAADERPRKRA